MKNNTLATFKEKRDGFKRFIRYLEQTTGLSPDDPVGSFDRKQSRRYLAWQHDQRGPNCSNKDRKVLTTAWKWGFSYMDNFPMDRPDPFLSCPRYAEKRCPRNIPPEEDFWKMYEAAYEREKALLTCFLNLAARKGELLKLTWEDVDFQRCTVVLTTRKTRTGTVKRDEMPMNEDVRQTMLWLSESGGHKQPCLYLRHRGFSREAVQVRGSCHGEALRKGGCESFGFHAIRHLAATILAQEGKSLFAIQHVLRHEKKTTTDRYLHSLGAFIEVSDALGALASRGPAHRQCLPSSSQILPLPAAEEKSESDLGAACGVGLPQGDNGSLCGRRAVEEKTA